jgi:hypothetical protein
MNDKDVSSEANDESCDGANNRLGMGRSWVRGGTLACRHSPEVLGAGDWGCLT